jgi:hypothetical protein
MGLRFRRSWSIIPGVRLNLGLRSGSVSFGVRGLHYTVGTKGSRVTVGVPGTGLFWTQKLSSASSHTQAWNPVRPGPAPQLGQVAQAQSGRTANPTSALGPAYRTAPQSGGAAPQISGAKHMHVFVPAWLALATAVVVGIGGLCLMAAEIGTLIH